MQTNSTAPARLNQATIEILAAAKRLHSLIARATSYSPCDPDPTAPNLGEHDCEAITRALAETMSVCASYLGDAGYETDAVAELADEIIVADAARIAGQTARGWIGMINA